MKRQTAIKIGIEAIEKRMQEISIDAGLFRQGVVKSIYTERCHEKLTRLENAVKELGELSTRLDRQEKILWEISQADAAQIERGDNVTLVPLWVIEQCDKALK